MTPRAWRLFAGASLALGWSCLIASSACRQKPVVQEGSEVRFHYTLTVDGQNVDTSRPNEPLTFVVGSGQIIAGLEEQLKGLSAGDRRSIVVPPEKGYGPVHPEAIQKVPKKQFSTAGDVKVGATVTAQSQGRMLQARVTEVTASHVTVDMNHPMAGKTLNFDIEVVQVSKPGGGAKTGT